MSHPAEFLWYIPNTVKPGHRGDTGVASPSSLETLTGQATALEQHGWTGALIGTGWGGPTPSPWRPPWPRGPPASSR